MIDTAAFINDFRLEFIDADSIAIEESTLFRELDSWDSLTGMSILVMIQDNYSKDFSDADFTKCKSVGEIVSLLNNLSNND